ncbi:MAG: hypothetical protein JNL54_01255 [Kineosporiaceae bacterium]|nr:hypothetical protein [Kineosporiaceae bacterium]
MTESSMPGHPASDGTGFPGHPGAAGYPAPPTGDPAGQAPQGGQAPSRTIKPVYLVAAGAGVLLAAGGVAYAVLGNTAAEPEPFVAPKPRTSASASATPSSTLALAPAVLATRDPFPSVGATGSNGTTGTTAAAPATTTLVSTTTSTTTRYSTTTRVSTSTTTRHSTTTVTSTAADSSLYVFVADVTGAVATLVVNDSVPVALNANESIGGVTFVETDPGDATCAMVKLSGADDASATSVCEGKSAKLD